MTSPDLQAALGRRSLGIDRGDHDALAAGAGHFARRRDRQAEMRRAAHRAVVCSSALWPASGSFGMLASVTSMLFCSPLRRMSSLAVLPGAMRGDLARQRSRESLTALPLTAVMTSPASMPALAAGVSALRLVDQRAGGVLQAEAFGDARA